MVASTHQSDFSMHSRMAHMDCPDGQPYGKNANWRNLSKEERGKLR